MDNFTCERCYKSTLGDDGICINCGWDKYMSEYSRDRINEDDESFESLEDLIDREYENEEQEEN